MFRSVGVPYSKIFDLYDIWLPRVQMHFDFRSPAKLDDLLEAEGWVGRFGRSSLTLNFATYRIEGEERTLTAEGHVVMVATERKDLRPVPIPANLVERLQKYGE